MLAHSNGNRPIVVYPEVIVASVKSRTELVISETSARVGLGFDSIDSSICVAQIQYFPLSIVLLMMYFWRRTTF